MEWIAIWFLIGFFSFALIFFALFFFVLLPRMQKANEEQKRIRSEEKIRKEQNKTLIEKEKLERELIKQKFEAEVQNMQPKFCQFCGTKFPAGSINCPSCGAKLQQ